MSTTASDYLRYGWQMLNGFRVDGEKRIATEREAELSAIFETRRPLKILDLGNGSLQPQYTLLQNAGHKVYGIDLVNLPRWNVTYLAYVVARWLYRWKLGCLGRRGPRTLVCGDVGRLPFPNDVFDMVTSVAAFEHFMDVPSVVAELRRVVRPGGVVYARIHLFTCPSGGHNVRTTEIPLRTLPRGVDPWDHLRKRRLQFSVPLNQWLRDQYVEIFSTHFEILKHYCAMREGEHLLNREIEMELSTYDRDELTCGAYVIVARKTF